MPTPAPYWTKDHDLKKLKDDLSWNFPEQRTGTIKIVGGNSMSFSAEVKAAEFINKSFPFIKDVKNLFPDSLKSKFPPLPNLDFYESTDSGSFANSPELRRSLDGADFGLILGDLSKNSVTAIAISEIIKTTPDVPLLLTRDTVDLVAPEAQSFMMQGNLTLVASLGSLQKLLRALYYPRPILLSQPIFPVVETLHKFTLTYPVAILTFHDGKIIAAENGNIATVDIEKTKYSPLSLWNGQLAASIAIYNMFNKNKRLDCMLAAVL